MSVNGVGGQPPTTYVGNSTGTGPVQSPKGGVNFTEIDPFSVQTGYSVEEQMAFDELSGGLPPPGWPPAKSSPQAQQMMDELGAMIEAAASSPRSTEGQLTMEQAMRMLKELMLKNRAGELSLRDQQIAQIYDLKLQAIEKDKEAAQATFRASLFKAGGEIGGGFFNIAGGVKQIGSVKAGADMNTTQAIGLKAQGMASGATGLGNLIGAFFDKKAADTRAEADTLRAMADKISNQLSQTSERFALAREVLLDLIQTRKSIVEGFNQVITKALV
jgi:hypothetical protein